MLQILNITRWAIATQTGGKKLHNQKNTQSWWMNRIQDHFKQTYVLHVGNWSIGQNYLEREVVFLRKEKLYFWGVLEFMSTSAQVGGVRKGYYSSVNSQSPSKWDQNEEIVKMTFRFFTDFSGTCKHQEDKKDDLQKDENRHLRVYIYTWP